MCICVSCSAVSDSLRHHGPCQAPLSMDSPGKNTRVGCHALLQGIFPTQGSNPQLSMAPALAGGFFTTNATWEALLQIAQISVSNFLLDCLAYWFVGIKKTNKHNLSLFLDICRANISSFSITYHSRFLMLSFYEEKFLFFFFPYG